MATIRILLLEDSPLDAELIRARLDRAQIDATIDRVEAREEFLGALDAGAYDLILADYALPSFDGLTALELAHAHRPGTPFLFVSGGLGEEVAIESLRRGATDYVTKQRLDRLAPAVRRALAEAGERAERQRAEARLRESEERRRLILDAVEDYAIISLDAAGRITSWSLGAERVLGFAEADVLGRPAEIIFTPEDRADGAPAAELAEAVADGRAEDERWHLRADGSRFWGSGVVRPLRDADGRPRGFVKVVRDMTERKRAEEALKEADRRKDEFLAVLAHELRNPLSAIHNANALARRSDRPEHQAWAKEVIARQVEHLARLIDDLLDISRISRDKIQLRPERLDLGAVVARAVESARPLISGRGHRLAVSVGPGPLAVVGDPTRLEQVVVNLLANAAKYTERGGQIELTAGLEGGRAVVRVADNGVGIAAEMLGRVFEPFAQVEQTIDRAQGGLGIGLTLARKLARLHGGDVTAASAGLGRGSTFTVVLPPAPADAAADAPAATPPAAATADNGAVRRARVLVVDDNVGSANGLATLLALSGHDVRTAFDGRAAIEAARMHRPEVVLLDIGLPGMDGYQVARHLRGERNLGDPLIIAVTGYGQDEDRRRSRDAGFDHHLVKPIDLNELTAMMHRRFPALESTTP